MKTLANIALLVELCIGFAKLLLVWVLALIWSPVFLLGFLAGQFGHVLGLLLVFLGGLGLWGLGQLVIKIMAPSIRIQGALAIKLFLVAGVGALCLFGFLLRISSVQEAITVLLPAIITVHLTYLGRRYLWG